MGKKFEPYKVGMCFTYKIKNMPGTHKIMQITSVMWWPGDTTANYFAVWLNDEHSAQHPMEARHAVIQGLYDRCNAAEILYG